MSELDSFGCRGASYKEGMLLLLSRLNKEWRLDSNAPQQLVDESKKQLRSQVEKFYQIYLIDLDNIPTFDAKEKRLRALLTSYSQMLCQHTSLSNCFQSLCMAERYAVWEKGRNAFTSEFTLEAQQSASPLEITQTESPCTDDELLLEEFNTLSTSSKPLWFKLLPSWQQNFISNNKNELVKQSIPSSLRCVPGLANLSLHRCEVNGVESLSYFRHATQSPVDLLKKKGTEAENEQFRLSCLNVASQIRLSLDQQFERNQGKDLHEVVILSQSILSPGWAADAKSIFFTDASDNDTQIYEAKEQVVELFQRAIANPDVAISSKGASKVKALFFNDAEQATTLYYRDFLAKFDLLAQPDGSFKYKTHPSIKISLLSTNHPFNILRRFGLHSPQTKRNAVNTAQLLGAVARYLKNKFLLIEENRSTKALFSTELFKDKNKLLAALTPYKKGIRISVKDKEIVVKSLKQFQNRIELRELMCLSERNHYINNKTLENTVRLFNESTKNMLRLLDAVQALLSIPASQGVLETDKRHYQQLISSAEATILHCIGGTCWVACKSGKDRTGGASAAYDAAAVFYVQRGRHPRYDDTKADRALYLSLLSNCHESGHQQGFAAQNAPGAKGLLGASLFLPGDMRLNVQKVKQETQLARLNKPKIIVRQRPPDIFKQLLENYLNETVKKLVDVELGSSSVLADWNRNDYYINGKRVREIVEKKGKFANEQALISFIESELFAKEQDEDLKKYYQALIHYSFHQGGFPHVCAFMLWKESMCRLDRKGMKVKTGGLGPATEMKVYYSYSENELQIKEVVRYKKVMIRDEYEEDKWESIEKDKNKYFCQTCSVISLTLKRCKSGGYKLGTAVRQVDVNFAGKGKLLEPLFSSDKKSLFERIVDFFVACIGAITQYFHPMQKEQEALSSNEVLVLNQEWLDNLAASVSSPQSMPQKDPVGEIKITCDSSILASTIDKAKEICSVTEVADEKAGGQFCSESNGSRYLNFFSSQNKLAKKTSRVFEEDVQAIKPLCQVV